MKLLFFDGSCEPFNPYGIATWGYVIMDKDGKIIKKDRGLACEPFRFYSTNNRAEYTALIQGLKGCLDMKIHSLHVMGDSQLVIYQLIDRYTVKNPNITPLYAEAKRLMSLFREILLEWIPKDRNKLADSLSKETYQEIADHFFSVCLPFGMYKGKQLSWVIANRKWYLLELQKNPYVWEKLMEFLRSSLRSRLVDSLTRKVIKFPLKRS